MSSIYRSRYQRDRRGVRTKNSVFVGRNYRAEKRARRFSVGFKEEKYTVEGARSHSNIPLIMLFGTLLFFIIEQCKRRSLQSANKVLRGMVCKYRRKYKRIMGRRHQERFGGIFRPYADRGVNV